MQQLTGHTLKDPQYTIDYHRGELLHEGELAGASATDLRLHETLRKPPIVLDAEEDVVLRVLEQQMNAAVPAGASLSV